MKNLKRIITSFLLSVFFVFSPLFAADGLLSGEKDLRVVQTKWFDIIYPKRSEKTAALLFQTADIIYQEVAAQYDMQPTIRYPLVITPATDQLNAFFTVTNYNRIVLFDTSSSEIDELSGSFSQGLLSVFRHELTHAVTYNMKNKFWTAVGKFFGDPANLGYLFLSSGMAEGATVTSESRSGQGRLNNEFFRHRVKQAKIENSFPSYFDMQGASDSYPSGAFYDFNAAFHLWLQEKYGMEKYAQFWYTLINFQRIGVASSFKKAYGIKLKDAWKTFEAQYQVPQIPANPVEAGLVSDFFKPQAQNYSERNRYGARYSDLSLSKKGMAWVEFSSSSVFYLPAEKYKQPDKAKKLITVRGLDHAKLSPDGNYLALSYYSNAGANPSAGVKIYEMANGRYFESGIKGLKDAAIVQADGSYYLVGQRYESPYNYIESYRLIVQSDTGAGKISAIEKVVSIQEDLYSFSGSFTSCGQGNFAYIQNKDLQFFICISDLQGKLLASYQLPENMKASQISYDEEKNAIYFNWTNPGSMVQLGRLSLESGTFEFSKLELSGGIFYPLALDNQIIYVGQFFRQNRLLRLSFEKAFGNEASQTVQMLQTSQPDVKENSALFQMSLDPDLELASKKYNPLRYLSRGVILPFSSYTSEAFGVNAGVTAASFSLPYGITFMTNNPWTSASEGIFQLTAGWGPETNSFGTSLTAGGGSTTGIFNYQASAGTEFDANGWKQAAGDLTLSSSIPFGRISRISLENTSSGKIGRQNQIAKTIDYFSDTINLDEIPTFHIGMYAPVDDKVYYRIADSASLSYSNIRAAGPGRFEYSGFSIGTGLVFVKDLSLEKNPLIYQDYLSLAASFSAYVPHLLPFESDYGYTYNLPLKVEASLFPASSNFAFAASSSESFGIPVFDAGIESLLFALNVQKAIPFFTPLFIHDFYITAGYTGTCSSYLASKTGFQLLYLKDYLDGLKDGTALYQDSLYLKCTLDINPNIGISANSGFKVNLSACVKYSLHQLEASRNPFGLVFMLGSSW